LTEKSALELAEYALSDYAMEASIGMAAINSLIEIDEEKWVEKNASQILMEKGAGADVAIIGHFPFIPELKKKARNLSPYSLSFQLWDRCFIGDNRYR